jgi:hypothetical protein
VSPTTRRAALGALAGVPAPALPAVAIAAAAPPDADADAELIALAAEIDQLCGLGEEIYAKRVDPFDETFNSLMDEAIAARDLDPMAKAFSFSRRVGREAAIKERAEVDEQAGRLFERMVALSAKTQAGRAAQVRTLLTFVHNEEWRGPSRDMDWEKERTRALLGNLAGMSEEELAAI